VPAMASMTATSRARVAVSRVEIFRLLNIFYFPMGWLPG